MRVVRKRFSTMCISKTKENKHLPKTRRKPRASTAQGRELPAAAVCLRQASAKTILSPPLHARKLEQAPRKHGASPKLGMKELRTTPI